MDAIDIVRRHFAPTRLVRAASLSTAEREVYLKLESELPTGSFKVRGAVYALTVNAARGVAGEVVAASTGNHGASVAYAARLLGMRATIFLPARSNPVKVSRIHELGARSVEAGTDLSAAIDAAHAYTAKTGAFFLHDASDPDIPAGTATIAVEVLEQAPGTETIYVPMGDTALIRGVAAAAKQIKPSIRIVGVAAENAAAYWQSWRTGDAVETATADTIADGLAVRRALAPNVAAIRRLVDEVRVVSEAALLDAIRFLIEREHVIAEPAGAAATAALLEELEELEEMEEPSPRGACVALVTGANIAAEVLASATERR